MSYNKKSLLRLGGAAQEISWFEESRFKFDKKVTLDTAQTFMKYELNILW